MKKHIVLLVFTIITLAKATFAANGWVYVDHYPWVYVASAEKWYWCWSPDNALWMTSADGGSYERMGEATVVTQDWVPADVKSATIRITATSATYSDDLGQTTVTIPASAFSQGTFAYSKTSATVASISFFNLGGYSGTYTLTFTSENGGTFYEQYTGPYTGYISGTFQILNWDVVY